MYGTVKREVRRHDRVYSSNQYKIMIGSAKKIEPIFQVKDVECESVLEFKKWWPQYFVKQPRSIESRIGPTYVQNKYI